MAEVMEQQTVGTEHTYQGVLVRIGDPVDLQAREALPPGSVINVQPDPHTTPYLLNKGGRNQWYDENGNTAFPANYGRNVLWSVPDGERDRQETIDEYRSRFRAKALDAAQRHLGDTSEVVEILTKLGVPDVVAEGQVVHELDGIPPGTVVMAADPSSAEYTVWTRDKDGWVKDFGVYDDPDAVTPVTVIDVPDTLIRHDPNGSDPGAIAMFKAKAWAEGWQLKRRHGWCSAYEQIMRDVGLTVGDALPPFNDFPWARDYTWRNLPQGAVLGYVGQSRWDFAVRDDSQNSGLRRVGGTSTGGLARAHWRVLWNGQGEMGWRLDAANLNILPVGASILSGTYTFTRRDDGMWWEDRGYSYNDADFGPDAVTVVGMP
jgi:hypothetical protein